MSKKTKFSADEYFGKEFCQYFDATNSAKALMGNYISLYLKAHGCGNRPPAIADYGEPGEYVKHEEEDKRRGKAKDYPDSLILRTESDAAAITALKAVGLDAKSVAGVWVSGQIGGGSADITLLDIDFKSPEQVNAAITAILNDQVFWNYLTTSKCFATSEILRPVSEPLPLLHPSTGELYYQNPEKPEMHMAGVNEDSESFKAYEAWRKELAIGKCARAVLESHSQEHADHLWNGIEKMGIKPQVEASLEASHPGAYRKETPPDPKQWAKTLHEYEVMVAKGYAEARANGPEFVRKMELELGKLRSKEKGAALG